MIDLDEFFFAWLLFAIPAAIAGIIIAIYLAISNGNYAGFAVIALFVGVAILMWLSTYIAEFIMRIINRRKE